MTKELKDNYTYTAIFRFDDDEIFVYFPDLPDVFTSGENEEEALIMARDVLGGSLSLMEEDNDPIPNPTPLTDIKVKENERAVLIDVCITPFRRSIFDSKGF